MRHGGPKTIFLQGSFSTSTFCVTNLNLPLQCCFVFFCSSEKLKALAKGLSPAYLRIGGTEADYVIFDPDDIGVKTTTDVTTTLNRTVRYNHDWYVGHNTMLPFNNFTLSGIHILISLWSLMIFRRALTLHLYWQDVTGNA